MFGYHLPGGERQRGEREDTLDVRHNDSTKSLFSVADIILKCRNFRMHSEIQIELFKMKSNMTGFFAIFYI